MRTIEELAELRDSLRGLMRECYATCPEDKPVAEEVRWNARRAFEQQRSIAKEKFRALVQGLSEEEWQVIRSTGVLAEILFYRRECGCCFDDGSRHSRFYDYKVNESGWKDFRNSLSKEDAVVIWDHIATHWLDWDCLDEVLAGHYSRRDYAGFGHLF